MDTNLAEQIKKTSMLRGEFVLKSGEISNTYFDKYRFESDPILLEKIAKEMVKLLPEGVNKLAGLEMGGIPLVTMISYISGIPATFIRKEAKKYGTCKFAEGAEFGREDNIIIVEDVVTSGSAVLDALEKFRGINIIPVGVICCIDREQGGMESIERERVSAKALFTKSQILN